MWGLDCPVGTGQHGLVSGASSPHGGWDQLRCEYQLGGGQVVLHSVLPPCAKATVWGVDMPRKAAVAACVGSTHQPLSEGWVKLLGRFHCTACVSVNKKCADGF